MIPYGRQDIREEDIEAVVNVLRSDFLTQGPKVPEFEDRVAARVGARHAVAVNSATSALHIACLALGLGPGDWLWTTPITFVASANCGLYCGASVDFVDIDPLTWNMSVTALRAKLEDAQRSARLPKIVVPVHLCGQSTDQEAIRELSREFGFSVIEDAAHAVGATHNGEPVGSCRWSDITVLSFHPVKVITTGEGGVALTNDAAVAERLRMLRSHGITRNADHFQDAGADALDGAPDGDSKAAAWYYEQQLLGFNYRITDLLAALGLSQLERLDEYVGRRNQIAGRYDGALAGMPLQLPHVTEGNVSAFHLYVVRSTADRRAIFDDLRAAGIAVNLHYMPVHLQPYYRKLGFCRGQFPEAEAYARTAISLPIYPTLSDEDFDFVVSSLRTALGHA